MAASGSKRTYRDVCYWLLSGAKRTSASDCLSIAIFEYTPWITLRLYCLGSNHRRRIAVMTLTLVTPLVSLLAGILILLVPRLLNYVVAIYLIFVGLVGFFA